MGRPERQLDPGGGAVTDFAAELRRLRHSAGSPGYRRLAAAAHFSATTLSEAAAGRRLPSLAVALGYARACSGDTAEWTQRWRAAQTCAAGRIGPAVPPARQVHLPVARVDASCSVELDAGRLLRVVRRASGRWIGWAGVPDEAAAGPEEPLPVLRTAYASVVDLLNAVIR